MSLIKGMFRHLRAAPGLCRFRKTAWQKSAMEEEDFADHFLRTA
jgi:hypothetical protein